MQGPVLLDGDGFPRYWPVIWSDLLKAGVADGTRQKMLRALSSSIKQPNSNTTRIVSMTFFPGVTLTRWKAS
jgi:hypothetical protein